MSRPPLELAVEVIAADGTSSRWDSSARARDRPNGLGFSTKRGDGFSAGAATLPRRIDRDWPDLNLYDSLAFIGADGSVAYEGRLAGMPRSMDAGHTINAQTAGWMIHARDRKFTEIYLDRDVSAWHEPPLARRITMGASLSTGRIPASASQDGLTWDAPNEALAANEVAELHYDAGPGLKAAIVMYRGTRPGTWTSFEAPLLWSSDSIDFGGTLASDSLTLDDVGHSATLATARQYLMLRALTTSAVTPPQGTRQLLPSIAVQGTHGIPVRLGSGTLDGVYASDIIIDVANRFCPLLNTDGVQATTWPIPHLVFKDRTDPYDAFLAVNAYHLWELAVWESRTLHYGPADLSDYDWEVRLSDPGVTVDLQGDSTEQLANGIVVEFTNLATGQHDTLTPDTTPELRDTNPANPATTHGITAWTEISLSSPTSPAAATQIGRAALAEFNQPKAPGSIRVTGHIRDRAGHWHPAWKVRANETIAITDHPNDRPRLITETQWDQDPKTLTVSVDSTTKRLDAVLDRVVTALTASGLT